MSHLSVYYTQRDQRWASRRFGNSTIADSGCGPTVLAMAIANLTKQPVLPTDAAEYVCSNGYFIPGTGLDWSAIERLREWQPILCRRVALRKPAMIEALNNREVIIASLGPGHFTKEGHLIMIYDYLQSENAFKIADPNDGLPEESGYLLKSSKQWKATVIIQEARRMWALKRDVS